MEVKLICDCEECHSCFLELGHVNILIDIPVKLLRSFSETLKTPLTCDYDASCVLYEKLNCSEIHVILVTNSRGFEGLDLLSYFYDLNNTHIVCTRSLYVLATIYYQNYSYELSHGLNTNGNSNLKGKSNKEDKFKGFHCNKLLNNLKEVKYDEGFNLNDYLNNNLLHLVSYNEFLKLDLTTSNSREFQSIKENKNINNNYSSNNQENNKENNKKDVINTTSRTDETHWSSYLNDFNVELELVAMSNGYSLGSCNYLIKHGNLREKVVLVSKSSNHNRYTKPFDYTIFDNLNKDDVVVLLSNPCNNNKYGNSNLKGKSNKKVKEMKIKQEVVVKEEKTNEDKMDVDEFQDGKLFDNNNYSKRNGDNKDNENQDNNNEVDKLGLYCIGRIDKGNAVLIPLDFNYEYLVDLLESLNRCIKKMKKQVFVYCVGKGIEDLFDYLEKCCEWVKGERSEYSMHSEDPKSPFPELDEMKINNKLFISDNVNGIANVYRVPSILILVMFKEEEILNYLSNRNNSFLILQNKFQKFVNNNNNQESNKENNKKVLIDTTSSSNHNFNYYKVDLEMDLSNVNTSARVVDVRKIYLNGNESVRIELHEENVGFVRCQMNKEGFYNLRFLDLDDGLKVNVFKVDLENMDDVIMKEKYNEERIKLEQEKNKNNNNKEMKVEEETNIEEEEMKKGSKHQEGKKQRGQKKKKGKKEKEESDDNKQNIKKDVNNKYKNKSTQEHMEKIEDDSDEEMTDLTDYEEVVDELMMFGNYDYNELVEELKKYFNNALVKVIKQPENRLVILSSSNLFNIVIDNDNKTTVIETIKDEYRKYILKSMQRLMITL